MEIISTNTLLQKTKMCMKFTKEAIQGPLGEIGRHGDLITQNLIRKKCIIILKRGQCRVPWVI